ncbi:MAG: polysaccharide deacetylase family protein [Pseudomonadota bacterium]
MTQKKRMVRLLIFYVLFFYPCICRAGMVSLTFDDGLSGTYRYAFPLLKKYNQAGTVGIIYNRAVSGNDDYMTVEQVLNLQKHGWEVASHSMTHKRPIEIPAFYRDEPIKSWTIDNKKAHTYQALYEYPLISCIVENGDSMLQELYALPQVEEKKGSFYFDRVIEELHIRPVNPVSPAKLDIRSGSYEREMEASRKELEKLGFKVSTYITPYNYWTDPLKEASKAYYDYVVTGFDSDNRRESFDPHCITRMVVHNDETVSSLMRTIKAKAVQHDDWVVLCLHEVGDGIGWEPWSAQKLDRLCAWLKKENIPVVTISQGAALFKSRQ